MNTRERITGIIVALVAPFDSDGRIKFDILQKHVDFLINQGVDGFYVNGSTGESLLMSQDERKDILNAVLDANNGRKAVICHCGAVSTDLSRELIIHAAEAGADAVSSIPPFYYHFSEEEIACYYDDLANSSDRPFIVYNMPSFSGVTITENLMSRIKRNPHISGLKFTHSDFYTMQQIKSAFPDLVVYNGFDEMAISGFAMGADGAIGSTYNVLAPYFLQIRQMCKQNDFQQALGVQSAANEIIKMLVGTGKLFASLKYVISSIEGMDYGVCRKPFAELSSEDIMTCKQVVQRINNWEKP